MLCFFLLLRLPPRSTLFPYTTLFRSLHEVFGAHAPAIEERDLGGETEVVGLADRHDDVLTGVEQAEHVGLGGGRLAHEARVLARAERHPIRAHELDAVSRPRLARVLLHRPPEREVGDDP